MKEGIDTVTAIYKLISVDLLYVICGLPFPTKLMFSLTFLAIR